MAEKQDILSGEEKLRQIIEKKTSENQALNKLLHNLSVKVDEIENQKKQKSKK